MKLIFATHNPGKIEEMQEILINLPIEILTADQAGVTEDVIEDGKTFEENALKKARFVCERTGEWTMADDSGICIDALHGAPGVLTARWAGEDATDNQLVSYTLDQLKDVPTGNRQATFCSVVVLLSPKGEVWIFEGTVRGTIPPVPSGTARPKLPYDVIFIPDGQSKTFGDMTEEQKNAMSHRGIAFSKLKAFLQRAQDTKEIDLSVL
ncbi:MAG: RdgB/HAM1 family non-canonical purine NTP pyrophosphatase [Patescibacteria group bacterium]